MNQIKTNNGINGGLLKGKPHYDSNGNSLGGIKAIVTDSNNKPVELEGEEVIINKKSVKSKKVLTVKGTPKEILSTINQLDGNGVAIGDEAEILDKYKGGGKIGESDVKVIGFSDDYTVCDRCGRSELKGTYKVLINDELYHLGTSCIAKKMELTTSEAKTFISKQKQAREAEMRAEIQEANKDLELQAQKFRDEWDDSRDYMEFLTDANYKNIRNKIEKNKQEIKQKYTFKYKTGGEIKNMTPSERKAFYNSPEGKRLDNETYNEWKELVNMSYSELKEFYNSPEGKKAGLSRSEAKEQGIDSGRTSARWILRMKQTPMSKWTSQMWIWAKKQISFIKRMSGVKGSLYNDNGKKTRKHTALLIWGHNPERKFNLGGGVGDENFGKIVYRGGIGFSKYFSTSKDIANDYAKNRGGEVKEYLIVNGAKIINYENVPNIKFKGINDWNIENYYNGNDMKNFYDVDLEKDYSKAEQWAKENNYDAIQYPTEGEVRIINEKIIIENSQKFNLGGAIDSSILINGYVSVQTLYIDHNIILEICLITYNSGGQSNLNVNDTMNATEMLKLFVDELDMSKFDSMQIIYDHRFKSNRIDSAEELDYYKNGFKTVIIDRDRIEFSNFNKKMELGGGVSTEKNNIDMIGEQLSILDTKKIDTNSLFETEEKTLFAKGGSIGENQYSFSKRIVSNWDEVPSVWKNTNKISKVDFEVNPKDKTLNSLVSNIVGNDTIRPVMMGINFDENGATATDAYKMLCIPAETDFRGIYPTLKLIDKKSNIINSAGLISGVYPDYIKIIPNKFDYVYEADLYKLLQYSNVADNFANKVTHQAGFKINDEIEIGFNVNYLSQICKILIQLGNAKCFFHFNSPNNACVISPDNEFVFGNSIVALLMPVLLNNKHQDFKLIGAHDIDFNVSLNCYFDFSKNEIINEDGSVVYFKMNYGEDSVFNPLVIRLLSLFKSKNVRLLPILENFVVENNIAKRTDIDNTIEIKNIDIPNGFYFVENGSVMQSSKSSEDISDYPKTPTLSDKLTFTIDRGFLLWAFDKLVDITGDDDLRPVMKSINLQKTNGIVNITATDAHLLTTIDATEYISIETDKNINLNIDPTLFYPILKSIDDKTITISIDSDINNSGFPSQTTIILESKTIKLTSKLIDGKYPNYKAVIPYENPNVLFMNLKDIKGFVSSKEAKNFISKHKTGADIIAIYGKEVDSNLHIHIFAKKGEYNKEEILIEDLFLGKIGFSKSDNTTNGNTASLIMPVMNKSIAPESLFTFNAKNFDKFLEKLEGEVVEFGYSEPTRAYVVGSKNIFYSAPKISLKEHIKPPKISVETPTEKTLIDLVIENDKNRLVKIERSENLQQLLDLIDYLKNKYADSIKLGTYPDEYKMATYRRNSLQRKELEKGTEHEKEHLETLEKVAKKEITPEQAVVETAKTHIEENPEYYEDLSKMESEDKKEESISDLIEGLLILLEVSEGEEKQMYKELIEGLELLLDDEEPIESFKDKINDVLYTVEKDEKGKWTVFSVSPKWEKRNEYPSAFTSKEDAIMIAKLDAGITKETDPEGQFMRNKDNFEKGGEMKSSPTDKIIFKPITTPL